MSGNLDPEQAALQTQLTTAAARYERSGVLAARMMDLEEQRTNLGQAMARSRREAGEAAERLERMSDRGGGLGAWLRSLFVRRDPKLGRARDERSEVRDQVAASMADHKQLEARAIAVDNERADAQHEGEALASARTDYLQLVARKEQWLRGHRLEVVAMLDESAERLAFVQDEGEALDRMIAIAGDAEGALANAKHSLHLAKMMANSGPVGAAAIIGESVTAGHMRDALTHWVDAERQVHRFADEMTRHREALHCIEQQSATSLATLMPNVNAVDLFVPRRVVDAHDTVATVLDGVRRIVWTAQKRRKVAVETAAAAEAERARWIEHEW